MIILKGILSLYVLWAFFLIVMSLERARDNGTLSLPAHILGAPFLYIGLLIDFLVNLIPVSILFLELPKEGTVTSRLSRHIHDSDGWRKTLATWFCKNLLDPFDPSGCHCK